MSGTIKAIERHMILPVRSGPESVRDSDLSPNEHELQSGGRKLVAEWQRGAEILGHAQRKLRLAFAPARTTAFAALSH